MTTSQGPHKRLPENPSEENLRKQAKALAKEKGLQLAAAQRQLAIEYGYQNWAELMEAADPFVPCLPLRALIAFPHEVYPIYIGRDMSIRAADAAVIGKTPILLVAQRDAMVASPDAADMYEVGALAVVVQHLPLPDGTVKVLLEGKKRVRVTRYVFDQDFYKAQCEELEEPAVHSAEIEKLMRSVLSGFRSYGLRGGKIHIPPEIVNSLETIADLGDPAILSDKMAGHLSIALGEKQALLECVSPVERLKRILGYLNAAV